MNGQLHVEVFFRSFRVDKAERLMKDILEGEDNSLVVRPKWTIADIGDAIPAAAPDRGLRAAILIPVTLESGSERTTVTVAVTKRAEWECESSLGRNPDLKLVARVMVKNSCTPAAEASGVPSRTIIWKSLRVQCQTSVLC